MTTAVQQESRAEITRRDFQRREATEGQRAALRGMWGKAHTDRGININCDGIPEVEHLHDAKKCPGCGLIRPVLHVPAHKAPWFRCCGWRA